MNLSIYLDAERAGRLKKLAKATQQSRNAIIRDAIDFWFESQAVNQHWPQSVLDFEGDASLSPFEKHRTEGKEQLADPFQ